MSIITITLGKFLIRLSRLLGHNGTALAGKVAERLQPTLLSKLLHQLPEGVVLVTGTNGKTTTTKLAVQLLEGQGKRVLTNRSGSNFTRGVLTTCIEKARLTGSLHYDVAVLELDEAYAKLFVQHVNPTLTVILNVYRDQLDRYGEITTTVKLMAEAAKESEKVLLYGNDELIASIAGDVPKTTSVHTFGLVGELESQLPNDKDLHACNDVAVKNSTTFDFTLKDYVYNSSDSSVHITTPVESYSSSINLSGIHNALNVVAAIGIVELIVPLFDKKKLLDSLHYLQPAFGRGETVTIHSTIGTFGLIKNPTGFNQNLKTLITESVDAILIAINDDYADGRDISWLWDVDITQLKDFKGDIYLSGVRAYDMALALKYNEITAKHIDPNIQSTLKLVFNNEEHSNVVIMPTYTAMLAARKYVAKFTSVEEIYK